MTNQKRTNWKNKFEIAEVEKGYFKEEATRLKKRLKEQEAAAKKRYAVILYCGNCKDVNACSLPPELPIDNADCLTCRVRGRCEIVRKVNV